uniref:Uncharacterized protein n=1 Tax=Anguilla anguilla TaxID=7936 RepID=A0A0E9WXR7_ANGAN
MLVALVAKRTISKQSCISDHAVKTCLTSSVSFHVFSICGFITVVSKTAFKMSDYILSIKTAKV